MVTLAYTPLEGIIIDKIVNDINLYNPDRIVILNELEWELRQMTPEFVEFTRQKNIDLKIVFGSFYDQYYEDFCSKTTLTLNDLIFWPTYWINWAEMCLRGTINYKQHKVNPNNFKYPFISLNNKNHLHREALIDHITKYGLLDKGVVTWHKFSNFMSGYKFKYYDDSIRTIDDDFATKLDSFLIPKQWHESFFHLVGEANINVHFISEKIVIPILMKKPFAAISKKGANKRLTDLGFVLYDEIVDYSYDDYDDVVDRANILCKSISQMPADYSELYKMLLPKIEHNYNRCLEIIKDINFIPKLIIDRVNDKDNNFKTRTDTRYEQMVNHCYDKNN